MNIITKLICEKNKISYIIFDKSLQIIEFSDSIEHIIDNASKLKKFSDIRDIMWEIVGIEEELDTLFNNEINEKNLIHFPMLLKKTNYYDLDIETFISDNNEKLFIAYIIQKPKESLRYINMIQEINKRTLVYENNEKKNHAHHYELINKRLLSFNVDMDGYITLVNDAFAFFFDISEDEILGKHFSTFFKARDLNLNENSSIIFNAINSMDEVISFHANVIPKTVSGKVYENIIICQDITYLKQIEKELKHASSHDSLTGLANRSKLLKKIDDAIQDSKTNNKQFAICFIDLNKFKPINDNYGHHAGDMLLKHLAKILLDVIRKSDLVARIGGDEFVILFHDIEDKEFIFKKIEKIKKLSIEKPLIYTEEDIIHFSFSFGLSYYPKDADNTQELLKVADKAMYKNKQA